MIKNQQHSGFLILKNNSLCSSIKITKLNLNKKFLIQIEIEEI
jgi:hypothetical protein